MHVKEFYFRLGIQVAMYCWWCNKNDNDNNINNNARALLKKKKRLNQGKVTYSKADTRNWLKIKSNNTKEAKTLEESLSNVLRGIKMRRN